MIIWFLALSLHIEILLRPNCQNIQPSPKKHSINNYLSLSKRKKKNKTPPNFVLHFHRSSSMGKEEGMSQLTASSWRWTTMRVVHWLAHNRCHSCDSTKLSPQAGGVVLGRVCSGPLSHFCVRGQRQPSNSHMYAYKRANPSYNMSASEVLLFLWMMHSLHMYYSAELFLQYHFSGTACHAENQVDGLLLNGKIC